MVRLSGQCAGSVRRRRGRGRRGVGATTTGSGSTRIPVTISPSRVAARPGQPTRFGRLPVEQTAIYTPLRRTSPGPSCARIHQLMRRQWARPYKCRHKGLNATCCLHFESPSTGGGRAPVRQPKEHQSCDDSASFCSPVLLASRRPRLAPLSASADSYGPGSLVKDVPVAGTPHVLDGRVSSIAQVGNTIILGGTFTQTRNNDSTDRDRAVPPRRLRRDHQADQHHLRARTPTATSRWCSRPRTASRSTSAAPTPRSPVPR